MCTSTLNYWDRLDADKDHFSPHPSSSSSAILTKLESMTNRTKYDYQSPSQQESCYPMSLIEDELMMARFCWTHQVALKAIKMLGTLSIIRLSKVKLTMTEVSPCPNGMIL